MVKRLKDLRARMTLWKSSMHCNTFGRVHRLQLAYTILVPVLVLKNIPVRYDLKAIPALGQYQPGMGPEEISGTYQVYGTGTPGAT
jgi:hypothetical protein